MKFILLITLIPFLCFSQTISINTGGSIYIESNSSFSIDGLELTPTNPYVITGPNAISLDSSPITVGNNSSINITYANPNGSGELGVDYLLPQEQGDMYAKFPTDIEYFMVIIRVYYIDIFDRFITGKVVITLVFRCNQITAYCKLFR